jgi:hypothetical protein
MVSLLGIKIAMEQLNNIIVSYIIFPMEKRGAKPVGQELANNSYVGIMPHDRCSSLVGIVPGTGLKRKTTTAICNSCERPVPIDWKHEMHNKWS